MQNGWRHLVAAFAIVPASVGAGAAGAVAWGAPAPPARVLCTTFPIYVIAQNVAAGHPGVELSLMLPPALGCPHDYVMTPQDMRRIAGADAVVINGLGLDSFLDPALRQTRPAVLVDTSVGIDGVLQEAGGGPNPHLFASPRLAGRIAMNVAAGLVRVDPAGKAAFDANAIAFRDRMERLAAQFAALGSTVRNPRIVTQHEVFDYLARDSGLEIAAVIEIHPGQEPSAAEVLDLVRSIRRLKAAAVFTEPQYSARIGVMIAKEAGVPAATLDPVASGPDGAGLDYYERVMRQNLATLQATLGRR